MAFFACRASRVASLGGLILLSAILVSQSVHAQTLTVLHSFVRPAASPLASLVKGKDGNFYGTTAAGGDADKGTAFRLDSVGNVTVLHSFDGSDGDGPVAGLIQATDGSFYGTTGAGGINGSVGGYGTVFKMDSSGDLTTLYTFTGGADGASPYAGVIQASDGNFYGTTYGFGAGSNFGTVFKMDSSGKLTTIYRFTGGADGQGPVASLIQARDGYLYGTTPDSSAGNGYGTIFRVDSSGTLSTLHSFIVTDGAYPRASLIQARDNNFYGTTSFGGANNDGTVFRMDSSGNVTILHSFANFNDGGSPAASLVQVADGSFYGTTEFGGGAGSWGSVFRMDSSGTLTTLHSFASGPDGSYPQAALVQATDGTLFGTTEGGGAGEGIIFRIDSLGNLTTFDFGGNDGAFPGASLVQGADGNFYGTTTGSGTRNVGTIFKLDSSGSLTTLHSFLGADGAYPNSSLIRATDGDFYGTTSSGGASSYYGTVFRMDSSGNLTTLVSFSGGSGGDLPRGSLVQSRDGHFYGTTFSGGANGYGTVFRMDSSGNLTMLHSFAGTDGAYPSASLIQASDGNFYGTTSVGGANGYGTIFKTDAAGNVTTLYSFADGPDGARPQAGLIQAADGNFYGTTSGEDGSDAGGQSTVFKTDSLGNLTTLYRFTGGSDGYAPVAGLIQARDGNFYGTTAGVGANNNGTVFRIDSSGNLTTLHSFIGVSEGRYPAASLLQANDGHFYGTTSDGGSRGGGTVFEIGAPSRGQRGDIRPVPIVLPVPVRKTDSSSPHQPAKSAPPARESPTLLR